MINPGTVPRVWGVDLSTVPRVKLFYVWRFHIMLSSKKCLKQTFFRYAVPSLITQWVYALYTIVDSLFVARGVSGAAFTAVNLSFPFISLIFSLSLVLAVGTSAVIGLFLGNGETEKANQVFTQNLFVQLILGILIPLIVLPNLRSIAVLLGAPDEETLQYTVKYLTWIVPFSFIFLASYSFDILSRTDGFPKLSAKLMILAALLNCFLDWLFVIVLKKGVEGAAFATSLAQTAEVVIYMRHFLLKKGALRFTAFPFRPMLLIRVILNGFSSGLTELSSGLSIFMFNHAILRYLSSEALMSYAVIAYINSLVVMSTTGIAQGVQPLISYFRGRREHETVQKLLWYSVGFASIFCTASVFFCTIFGNPLAFMYLGNDNAALIPYTAGMLRIYVLSFIPLAFNISIGGFFTAIERPAAALLISVGRGMIFLIAALSVLTDLFAGAGIFWAPLLSESLCFVMSAILLIRESRSTASYPGCTVWGFQKLVREGLFFGLWKTQDKKAA